MNLNGNLIFFIFWTLSPFCCCCTCQSNSVGGKSFFFQSSFVEVKEFLSVFLVSLSRTAAAAVRHAKLVSRCWSEDYSSCPITWHLKQQTDKAGISWLDQSAAENFWNRTLIFLWKCHKWLIHTAADTLWSCTQTVLTKAVQLCLPASLTCARRSLW